MNETLLLGSIILVGVVLVLALRKFQELDTEFRILNWIVFKLTGRGGKDTSVEAPISAVIERHNEDFSTAVSTGDMRYLSATTAAAGLSQVRQQAEEVAAHMREVGWESCNFLGCRIVGTPVQKRNRVFVDVDETWQYRARERREAPVTVRNRYVLVREGGEWRIQSCEVFRTLTADT